MKVLMVSRYVQPAIKNSNSNVDKQVRALLNYHNVKVDILTWPFLDGWMGPVPDKNVGTSVPPMKIDLGGLDYYIINPPDDWNSRVLQPDIWNNAVNFGIELLQSIKPDILHLQHWVGLWWILEAAQRLGIATVYSNHDWGIACLRTILVQGNGTLCDGHVNRDKCVKCIWQGRGFIGKANELFVQNKIGRAIIQHVFQSPMKKIMERYGAIQTPLPERVEMHLKRVQQIVNRLNLMLVPSNFARDFFVRLGVSQEKIIVRPWYHDPISTKKSINSSHPFTLTYIGRVSPEKGIHIILEALRKYQFGESILLRIAGSNSSKYCTTLKKKYRTNAGSHDIEWLGWSEVEPLFLSTDAVIIPSCGVDNTPLSLIEAISYNVPVIATKIPTIEELVCDSHNGYLAEFNSTQSLVKAIQRAIKDKIKIRSNNSRFPAISTSKEYTKILSDAYKMVLKRNEK